MMQNDQKPWPSVGQMAGGLFNQGMLPYYTGLMLGGTRGQQGQLATQAAMGQNRLSQDQQQFDSRQQMAQQEMGALEAYRNAQLGMERRRLELAQQKMNANPYTQEIEQINAIPDQYLGGPQKARSVREAMIQQLISGGDKGGGTIPSEIAGKAAAADAALQHLGEAEEFYNSPGSYDAGDRVRDVSVPFMGRPFSGGESGRARRQVRMAVEAALRLMTGAAAPDSEVARYEDMFAPSATDTAETAQQKLTMLRDFIQKAREYALQGRGVPAGQPTAAAPTGGQPPSIDDLRQKYGVD